MTTSTQRANAIRALAMDAVEQAKSGHPGAPMGFADIAEVLWRNFIRFNPTNPNWFNRDRVVLSNGHASMLLYSVLHLTGYDISIEDIKKFRQLHSKTPGHPEYGECPGIETTTGPLGQGLANAVGMAIAERQLACEFNRPGHEVVNHRTWAIVGDGCLMEGISHEVASLAGTFNLGKLVVLYDDNGISIDGETKDWFTESVPARFKAYGWNVVDCVDGHDRDSIQHAFQSLDATSNQPKLVVLKTQIGFGAPTKAGTASAHGAPLGEHEIRAAKQRLNWNYGPFKVPQEIYEAWDMRTRGDEWETEWKAKFQSYKTTYPKLAEELERRIKGELSNTVLRDFDDLIRESQQIQESMATRKASGSCLNFLGPRLPELIGGSADLTDSNNTKWQGSRSLAEGGRYVNFGVREFGMTAIANGIALHGGLIPYTGTFLVFMDYARNAVRLAALMGLQQILVYTHDSIGLGEDGPTHQPVEHLTNLRTTPNVSVWRPCDKVETAMAWSSALKRKNGPTAIVLTRQPTEAQSRDSETLRSVSCGGYILKKESSELEIILIATGSEVELAMKAVDNLEQYGTNVRVVSMPCVDRFLEQDDEYQKSVLPSHIEKRLAIEAGHPDYWKQFVGLKGKVIGIDRFGVSAPGAVAMDALGFSIENVKRSLKSLMQ